MPVSDFFWGAFLKRWREELGLALDTDIYSYYDLDWVKIPPNLDPHVKPFEIIKQDEEEVIAKTGFEAVVQKKFNAPMPAFLKFETDTLEKMEAFSFDDPWDERRFFAAGDNQLAGLGDGFERNTPAFTDMLRLRYPDFPVFGEVCEAHEYISRIIGAENALLWMGLYPDEVGRFVERIGAFTVELCKAEIKAAGGMLAGMIVWGDVAYVKDVLFSPAYWRKYFQPIVKALAEVCHQNGLPVIYHSCGNTRRIFGDLIETGIDCYNPLEFKAGMDAVELRRQYGHRIGFCGNMDCRAWAEGDPATLTRLALTRLNAAKGGGYLFQSDHSVPGNVPPSAYEYVLALVRRHGVYPLELGEFDERV